MCEVKLKNNSKMYCQSPVQMAPVQKRCPVCRLFLLPDMLLSEHLDTHPKDQVILALIGLIDKQNISPRSSSPWIGGESKAPSSVVNNQQTFDNNRSEWGDTTERAFSFTKIQEESWSAPNIRSTVLTSSPNTTYWQMQQNSAYANDLQLSTSPDYACSNHAVLSNNSQPLTKPVINKTILHENTQKVSVLSATIPVIQRIDNIKSNSYEFNLQSSSPGTYARKEYIEQQNIYNRYNTINQSSDSITINNHLETEMRPTEKSFVPETSEINDSHNICITNEAKYLQSINKKSSKTLRRDIIIQPAKTKLSVDDALPVHAFLQDNNIFKTVDKNFVLENSIPNLPKEIQTNTLKMSKMENLSKETIEILSESVIDNCKYSKKRDLKTSIIKQKKNKEAESDYLPVHIESIDDRTSCHQIDNLKKNENFEEEDSEKKMINNNINDEKSYDTNSVQDTIYDIEQRRTTFSPNLVIINLETNDDNIDSAQNKSDIDVYQEKKSDCESVRNLNGKKSHFDPQDEQPAKNKELSSKFTNAGVYQNNNFNQNNSSIEELLTHGGPKIISSDNFKQNFDYSLSSESLNIRTDEKMPARGELSEQESTDSSSWAYQNACTSFPLNLPTEENELNLSQYLTPMLEPSSSCSLVNQSDSNRSSKSNSAMKQHNLFRCPHCTDDFVCPKERRVHISRCHPNLSSEFMKEQNGSVVNSFESSQDYYTPTSSNHLNEINVSNKENLGIIPQAKCNNFDSSLLVSSMNIINNTDIISEPLESLRVDLKSRDIKADLNLFSMNQNEFCEDNVKSENTSSRQNILTKNNKGVSKKNTNAKFTYTCIICQDEFKTVTSFNVHLKKHPLECRICAKLFTKKQVFDEHESKHLCDKKHICPHCSKSFFTEKKLRKHICKLTVLHEYKCTICTSKFQHRQALIQHKLTMHKIKPTEKIYFCHCGQNFPSFAKLYYHKETHDTKPKNCKFCTQKFMHLISLNRHIRMTHNDKTIENSETCQICDKSLSKHSIKSHMKLHRGNALYNCFICNKNFSTRWNLKQHKYVHQNRSTKPHKCPICPSAFIRLQDYHYHMNSHKKIYSFVCNQCGRKFIRKYNYLRHVKEHSQEKKYQCTVSGCAKVFHRKYYLTEHMRTHTGSRPFVCTICSKTSSTKTNHNKHVKIHHANTRDSINVEN